MAGILDLLICAVKWSSRRPEPVHVPSGHSDCKGTPIRVGFALPRLFIRSSMWSRTSTRASSR